jgi:hypothetical protein
MAAVVPRALVTMLLLAFIGLMPGNVGGGGVVYSSG